MREHFERLIPELAERPNQAQYRRDPNPAASV